MTKEELIEFLKDNLKIKLVTEFVYDYDKGGAETKLSSVKLLLGEEEISESYF